MPSTRVWFCVSKPYERKPDWLPVFEPPTSNAVIWMPGACDIAAQTSRAFGISVSSSLVKLVPICRRRGIDDRRGAGDGDGFLQRRDLQLHVDRQRLVDDDANVLALDRVEAGELEVDRVDARRQRQEAVAAVAAGDLYLRLNQRRAGSRDGDARQHGAGVVRDGTIDTAAEFLCESGRCRSDSSITHRQTRSACSASLSSSNKTQPS